MKQSKHVRVPADILQNPLVRKANAGLIIPWILIKLVKYHGYIPPDELDPDIIAEDLGLARALGHQNQEALEAIVILISDALTNCCNMGLLYEGSRRVNVGGRNGNSFKTLTGWTSPLAAKPVTRKRQTRQNQTKPSQTNGRHVNSSPQNDSGKGGAHTRARFHTHLSNKLCDPPGHESWSKS